MRISSGSCGSRLDLLPQMPHVDVDRARLAVVGAAAQALEQLPSCPDDTGVGCEQREQLELDERQLHGRAAHLDGAATHVDAEIAVVDHLLGRALGGGIAARRSSALTRLRNSRIENGLVM